MVKKLVSVLCICAYFGLAHAQIPQEIWKESEQIEKQIKKTSFPDRVYNIKDFGQGKRVRRGKNVSGGPGCLCQTKWRTETDQRQAGTL